MYRYMESMTIKLNVYLESSNFVSYLVPSMNLWNFNGIARAQW